MFIDESVIQETINCNIGHRIENANIRIIDGKAFVAGVFRIGRVAVRVSAIAEMERVLPESKGASLIIRFREIRVSRSNNSKSVYYLGKLLVQLMRLKRPRKLSDGVFLRWPFIELNLLTISELKQMMDRKWKGLQASDAIRIVDCNMVDCGVLMKLDVDSPLLHRLSLN